LEQDLALDPGIARRLGYGQVTLRAGQYAVDYSENPLGRIIITVELGGIVITVETGRGTNCTGFGICSITVESRQSPRSVPAVASWEKGRLHLSYLSDPPDKSDVLVVDKDVLLDSATSRALGYEHVMVKAGQYPVDYSANPHGHVSPDVVARGIVITIYFGKPSANCRGFGFCDITIELSLSDRAVPAAATWENGRLHLSNLAEPPDKSDVLVVEKDIVLDSATSRALGYEQVTVKAGQYPMDYTTNPHGHVSPDVVARGIVITIYFGKPSANCRGFGFCDITIEPSLSDRAVPAAATWDNGRLHLSNLAEPPDKSDVLVVEKDIVLDSATSRALGHEQVTVKAGQYPVDYSAGTYGQVAADSITRQMDIGFAPGGGLSITWPNGWILQEAVEMGGPWVNTADQTSPATIQPDSSRKFYRLVSP
jgi:uncharacterized lipoprotein YbaY